MFRCTVLRAGMALGVSGLAGCAASSDRLAFTESFEDGLDDWTPAATIGPEVDSEDFAWVLSECPLGVIRETATWRGSAKKYYY